MTRRSRLGPVRWRDRSLEFIDQTDLPSRRRIRSARTVGAIVGAIQRLEVRGAPLLGIVGAFGAVLAWDQARGNLVRFKSLSGSLAQARPTAVNLGRVVRRMAEVAVRRAADGPPAIRRSLLKEARRILREEQESCRRIGELGVRLLRPHASLLTLCNTGELATGGIGTAFGIIRVGWSKGLVDHVYVCETRPLLQGARLTMWELGRLGIPATLLTDNSAGWALASGRVSGVIVGADRIASNGDTANKVGTYTLSVLARENNIPFIVAAPWSSVDMSIHSGAGIPIEMRRGREVTSVGKQRIAPSGARALSPAFDVTPAKFISAFVSDRGIIRFPNQRRMRRFAAVSPGGTL